MVAAANNSLRYYTISSEGPRKTKHATVRLVRIVTGIRTRHLLNKSPKHYRYSRRAEE